MFAYDNLVQWFKDRCSDQVSRRNRAWNFGRGCRAWPSCLWPWWCGRPCPWWSCRGVLAVSVVSHWMPRRAVPWRDYAAICVVTTRRWMLVFAMVLAVSVLSQFALHLQGVYSESHQANNNEEKGKISSGYADRDGNPGAPKNRRHG